MCDLIDSEFDPKQEATGWLYLVPIKGICCLCTFLPSIDTSPRYGKAVTWYEIELFGSGRILLDVGEQSHQPLQVPISKVTMGQPLCLLSHGSFLKMLTLLSKASWFT